MTITKPITQPEIKAAMPFVSDVLTLKMPPYFLFIVITICLLPITLMMFGVDFSSSSKPLDLTAASHWPKDQQLDAFFYRLSGAFTHTILEWTAFSAAILTTVLAFSHYLISKDYTTPVIGAALFLAGCMDAFHTLAAARLIEAVADNRNLIPFTWAICRIFNAIILIGGVTLLLIRKPHAGLANMKFLLFMFILSALVAYGIIHYCAVSATLPQTQFPNNIITRPYDVVPLVLFVFAGCFLFPYYYQQQPSVFAHALVIAMIPEVVLEFHMAFGSSSLFDDHFNVAHFLKIFAYVIPFCGLLVDYTHTYREKESEINERKKAEVSLQQHAEELKHSNDELDKFAHITSHDLKAPLRGIKHLATWIEEDKDDSEALGKHTVMLHQRILRMEKLLNDLLAYSVIGKYKEAYGSVDVLVLAQQIFELSSPPKSFTLKLKGQSSIVNVEVAPLETVMRNLIGNAIKHHEHDRGEVTVAVQLKGNVCEIIVSDNGPGIDERFHGKIFEIFQTLAPRDSVEGSGIGLALVKKIMDQQGGSLEVKSKRGMGTQIIVQWRLRSDLTGEFE